MPDIPLRPNIKAREKIPLQRLVLLPTLWDSECWAGRLSQILMRQEIWYRFSWSPKFVQKTAPKDYSPGIQVVFIFILTLDTRDFCKECFVSWCLQNDWSLGQIVFQEGRIRIKISWCQEAGFGQILLLPNPSTPNWWIWQLEIKLHCSIFLKMFLRL